MQPSTTEPRLPRSLSSVKSAYAKMCDELGGPADIGATVDRRDLERYCNEIPLSVIRPVLIRFQNDENAVRRHWPWVAFALSQFIFERHERAKYTDELKPEEIQQLLSRIATSANELVSALCQLQSLANRLPDPSAAFRRAHLAWLDAFISQAAAGRISSEVDDNGTQMAIDFFGKMEILKRITGIEAAAITAMKRVDPTLLKKERGQSDPALPTFVFRCGKIWTGLTGRKASAQKVHKRDGSSDPDFVVFIQELAKIGKAPPPSRNQVSTSLLKKRSASPT